MAVNILGMTDHSEEVLEEMRKAIEAALEEVGLAAEGYAKRLCPVDTGRLRNSITYATEKTHDEGSPPAKDEDYELHGTPEAGTVYIGTNVEYAPYVELGTSKQDAQPFLKPAVLNNTGKYKKIFESHFKS